MSTKSWTNSRTGAAFVLLAAAGGAAFALGAKAYRALDPVAAEEALGVVSTQRDGFRYEYHAPSGRESLFDLAADPDCLVNVASSHAGLVVACRTELETSLGVKSIEELRAPYAETIRRLEAMGYL
jgi:hypothetical protein